MNDHDRTEDDGLAPDEGTNWERQESGEEASIQVYLDDGWYWDSRKLTHPTDKELNIRIDPLTRDWYPTTKSRSSRIPQADRSRRRREFEATHRPDQSAPAHQPACEKPV